MLCFGKRSSWEAQPSSLLNPAMKVSDGRRTASDVRTCDLRPFYINKKSKSKSLQNKIIPHIVQSTERS